MQPFRKSANLVWGPPEKDENDFLFMESLDQVLSVLAIYPEELDEWHNRGWVSFNHEFTGGVSSPRCSEIEFICNLARSGMTNDQIDTLLQFLDWPYRYDPENVVFHSRLKWVSPKNSIKQEMKDLCRRHVQIRELHKQMNNLLKQLANLNNEDTGAG